MGCPSRDKAKSQLPIIQSAVKMASRGKESGGAVRIAKKPLRAIRDFHCPDCGVTKKAYPNYNHRCPGIDANGPIDYQVERAAICGKCEHNRGGVCLPLKVKLPDHPCEIAIGLRMPAVQCPLHRWRRVLFNCDKCGSVRFDPTGLTQCPTCRPKPKPKAADACPVHPDPV